MSTISTGTESVPRRLRLLVVVTHPIQYFAPWFRHLAQRPEIDVKIIYLRQLDTVAQGVGFGTAFSWDVPLLEGYVSETVHAPTGAWSALRRLPTLWRTLRVAKADAIVVTGWQEPLLAAAIPLTRLLGVPLILRGESNDLRERGGMARTLHRVIVALASAAIVIGKSNRAFYEKASANRLPLFDGAYFVDNNHMSQMVHCHSVERDPLRRADRADENAVVFAFCGKHVAFKRPDWLVEAAGRLVAEGGRLSLRFAGSGEMTDALKARCAELGVTANFTGFLNQTEMWKAYIGADIFVLPSTNRETWGLVVNEAMVFGLPAIVSDEVGCGPDLIVQDETGWVFSGGVDGLAAAMRRAIAQRDRLPAMGAAARERVTTRYTMDVATDGLLAAMRSVVR